MRNIETESGCSCKGRLKPVQKEKVVTGHLEIEKEASNKFWMD